MALRDFVLVGLTVASAALLGGCETYSALRRDLGVDPVDPPRMTASPPAAPVAGRAPLPAGDVSQASWAAQRTASYQNQRNTIPVGYVAPPEDKPEDKAAAQKPDAGGQPMSIKPADKATGKPAAEPAAKPAATAAKPMTAKSMPEKTGQNKAAALDAKPMAMSNAANKGLWRVHLASHRTEGAAINEWQELLKRDPKLYGQYDPQIEWVDLQGRGSFARLMLGGWAERKEADAACAKIRGPRRYCAVIKQ